MNEMTDKRIDLLTERIRRCAVDITDVMPPLAVVNDWLAAVETRARRQVAAEIAEKLRAKWDKAIDAWHKTAQMYDQGQANAYDQAEQIVSEIGGYDA